MSILYTMMITILRAVFPVFGYRIQIDHLQHQPVDDEAGRQLRDLHENQEIDVIIFEKTCLRQKVDMLAKFTETLAEKCVKLADFTTEECPPSDCFTWTGCLRLLWKSSGKSFYKYDIILFTTRFEDKYREVIHESERLYEQRMREANDLCSIINKMTVKCCSAEQKIANEEKLIHL